MNKLCAIKSHGLSLTASLLISLALVAGLAGSVAGQMVDEA